MFSDLVSYCCVFSGYSIWLMKTTVPAAGLILNIAYGYNVHNCEDPFVTIADEATRNTVNAGGPGAALCDMFPMRELISRVCQGSCANLLCFWDADFPDIFI